MYLVAVRHRTMRSLGQPSKETSFCVGDQKPVNFCFRLQLGLTALMHVHSVSVVRGHRKGGLLG